MYNYASQKPIIIPLYGEDGFELRQKAVEFLPPYSPELDPTEACRKAIRADATNSTFFPTLESMQEEIESFVEKKRFKLNLPGYLCR